MVEIKQNIVGYQVVDPSVEEKGPPTPEPVKPWVRPDVMHGRTFKIAVPNCDHRVYMTVNTDEAGRPWEMFLSTKNPEWHALFTYVARSVSAVLRHGGGYEFIFDEMCDTFDPKGGYFIRGGKYMPSVIAHLGHVLKQHYGKKPEVDPHMAEFIAKKRAEVTAPTDYPEHATVCKKCHAKAVVRMDNCETCLACSDSKCG